MAHQRFDYSGLQIDRGIPIPESVTNPAGSTVALFISKLNVGDSFVIPNLSMYTILQHYAKKSNMVLRLRNVGENGQNVYRIWRIK